MPRFAANLSMLYNDVDFLDRFAAARDGFKAVEYPSLTPTLRKVGPRLQANGLQQVLFNAPPVTGTRASAGWPACRA